MTTIVTTSASDDSSNSSSALGLPLDHENEENLPQQTKELLKRQEPRLVEEGNNSKSTDSENAKQPLVPPMTFAPTVEGTNEEDQESPRSISPSTLETTQLPPQPLQRLLKENNTTSSPRHQPEQSMEDRVAELEAKLSTLTLLLQAATKKPLGLAHSPVVTRSVSPSLDHNTKTPPTQNSPPLVPPLESPCALGPQHRRLSEVLLNDSFSSSPPLQTKKSRDEKESPNVQDQKQQQQQEKFLVMESLPNLTKIQQPKLSPPEKDQETKPEETVQQQEPNRKQWLNFLNSFQESTADVDMQMEEFVRVPSQVEQLLGFGLWICVDCFLYVITVLPIRFVWSFLLGILTILGIGDKHGPFRFHRRHLYQLMQVSIIFIVYHYILCNISIGKLYHWIRGQVMLKLYLLIAIVEVFDRLMCSLGQDCLDSLYWNTTRRPHSKRMLVSMSVVLIYAIVHTILLFVHVATLNVAMNSADQALLSLLIGGNFAEIKSTVFKKYNKQHLFKITASDICERFKLALFLTLVLTLNVIQGMDWRMVYDFCYMCGIVWVAELLSDWVKHSFITKFNYIKSSVYPEYALLLAGDVTGIGHEGVNLDHSHAVVKRIGLAQIPLVCVMFRYLTEAARYGAPLYQDVSQTTRALFLVAVWLILVLIKFVSGSLLLKVASQKLENAPHVVSLSKKRPSKQKKEQ